MWSDPAKPQGELQKGDCYWPLVPLPLSYTVCVLGILLLKACLLWDNSNIDSFRFTGNLSRDVYGITFSGGVDNCFKHVTWKPTSVTGIQWGYAWVWEFPVGRHGEVDTHQWYLSFLSTKWASDVPCCVVAKTALGWGLPGRAGRDIFHGSQQSRLSTPEAGESLRPIWCSAWGQRSVQSRTCAFLPFWSFALRLPHRTPACSLLTMLGSARWAQALPSTSHTPFCFFLPRTNLASLAAHWATPVNTSLRNQMPPE